MPHIDFQELQDRISCREFYSQYFPTLHQSPSGWASVFCCFHPDRERSESGAPPKKSAGVNLNSGWFQCYSPSCGFSGGMISFYQKISGKSSLQDAAMELAQKYAPMLIKAYDKETEEQKEPLPTKDQINHACEAFRQNADIVGWFKTQRGLEMPILEKFKIGLQGDRVWIPVYDLNDQLVNVRKYHPVPKNPVAKIINVRGHGLARIFPISVFKKEMDSVIVCEGEWDAVLCHQMGFDAVTTTAGAKSWRTPWNRYFRDLIVTIAYDNDEEGIRGGLLVASLLLPYAREVRIAVPPRLPYLFQKHEKITKDLSDLAIRLNWGKEKFQGMFAEAKRFTLGDATTAIHIMKDGEREETPIDVTFPEARESKNYAKPIKFAATVEGKKYVPYVVPQQVTVSCEKRQPEAQEKKKNHCGNCPLVIKPKTVMFDHRSQEILSMIDVTEIIQKKAIASLVGFPETCIKTVKLDFTMQNVDEITLTDTIEWKADVTYELIHQTAYSLVKGVEANRPYRFSAVMYPHPTTQEVTFIIYKAEPAEQSIDKFKMTPEIKGDLSVFQAHGLAGLEAKLEEIYDEFEKFWKRYELRDYFFALDLFFHSVISFHLRGELVKKGWIDALIIGDTRTAKSTSAEYMIQHYRAGEIISAEGTTFAGLVGGTQQIGKNWSVTWGALVRNDRRAVILDEVSGMKDRKVTISQLSGIRSSGIADITKIQGGRALARTRLLMLSNPVSSDNNPQTKWLSEYSQPVRAIPELIGENADIARLDFALGVMKNSKIQSKIHEMRQAQIPRKFTSDRCHKLVIWAWSRKPYQIQFEDLAVTRVVECVKQHVQKYWSGIPLVLEAEHHKILAKAAVACAARFFSTDDTGENIIVKPEHVELVAKKFDAFYSSKSLAYDAYSELERKLSRLGDISSNHTIMSSVSKENVRDQLLRNPVFQKTDIYEIFQVTVQADKQNLINTLINLNAFRRAGNFLKPTESFLDYVRHFNNSPVESEMDDEPDAKPEPQRPDWAEKEEK